MKVHLFILSAPISLNLRFMIETRLMIPLTSPPDAYLSFWRRSYSSLCLFICLPCALPRHSWRTLPPPSPPPSCLFFPGPWGRDLGSRPASPQPIRLTRPVLKQTSAADIVLENPVETGWAPLLPLPSHLPNSDPPVHFMVRDVLPQAWRFGNRKRCGSQLEIIGGVMRK